MLIREQKELIERCTSEAKNKRGEEEKEKGELR